MTVKKKVVKKKVDVKMMSRKVWNEMYDYVKKEIEGHNNSNVKCGLDELHLHGIRFYYGNPVENLQMETHNLTWKNDGITKLPGDSDATDELTEEEENYILNKVNETRAIYKLGEPLTKQADGTYK